MKTSRNYIIGLILLSISLSFGGCEKIIFKKDSPEPDPNTTSLSISISDGRLAGSKKTDQFTASLLTKFVVTVSRVALLQSNGNELVISTKSMDVNLRDYRGLAAVLATVQAPYGTYTGLRLQITGVQITYNENVYTANATGASFFVKSLNQSSSQNIPNPIAGGITLNFLRDFELSALTEFHAIRVFYDVESACDIQFYNIPIVGNTAYLVPKPMPFVQMIFEQAIQQTSYSPPLGVTLLASQKIGYYGLHTFVDFAQQGGTVTAHTSQHVFRGENANLLIDAEAETVNASSLLNATIAATIPTVVHADEVFDVAAISTNLAAKGYTLVKGKVYYFSLRKTWTIATQNREYTITRVCEPIPVIWP